MAKNAEKKRIAESTRDVSGTGTPWKEWGPYLSERQWGTVREDYSSSGDAWSYFSHDQSRSRAYRWGEDGLAGISNSDQTLCFALALWNGCDPILKERLFGLTNSEGNHGEDVKEYYFYLDSTPTHSYMKYLYKYPQRAYPYLDLVQVNRARSRYEFEYELIDAGAFDEDRYFDVWVEYAKASPQDILVRITATNRGPDPAPIHLLPTLWFRNTWSWAGGASKPVLRVGSAGAAAAIDAYPGDPLAQAASPEYTLLCDRAADILFTDNETNNERLFGAENSSRYVKDAFHEYLINGKVEAVNPEGYGTKAAVVFTTNVEPGESAVLRLRLSAGPVDDASGAFGRSFDALCDERAREADDFYNSLAPDSISEDEARVMRQALAGMLWTKQFYYLDADRWLSEHHAHPLYGGAQYSRNREWFHLRNAHIISMPDKWEYPWYAAWDLAFHAIALSVVDPEFAKQQLDLMLRETYLHPSGQIPAYEWNFSDVNPPVHAWAALFVYRREEAITGTGDIEFLKRMFNKLTLNFTWWVNRKDRFGKNVFEGGFLGLDNIGVFDRSSPLPTGGYLEQADGTAWMSLFCQNMIEISVELAARDSVYADLCTKFVEHFLWIATGLNRVGPEGMWDETDGFYYDVLRRPDGSAERLKVRSLVGLLPLCAATVVEEWQRERVPQVLEAVRARLTQMPELLDSIHAIGPEHQGVHKRAMLALVNTTRLRRILSRMLDEAEFLGPYGIRSVSRAHLENPYVFDVHGEQYRVQYLPAESDSGMFGGNSNWRGPVWMPVNALIIRSLLNYYLYYGDSFKVECPTGSGVSMNLFEVSRELARRLTATFLRDEHGRRPVFGGAQRFQTDPHWRDHLLFYEYFHGDNGAGLGASHQTGWTGLVAGLIDLFGRLDAESCLEAGKRGVHGR